MWLRLVRGIAVLAIVVGAWSWQPVSEATQPVRDGAVATVALSATSDAAAPVTEISTDAVPAPPVEPAADDAELPTTGTAVPPRSAERSTAGVRAPPRAV